MFKKKIEVPIGIDPINVIGVLCDKGFVLSNMPYVVGRSGEGIALEFRRLRIFRFRDNYEVLIECGNGSARLRLRGSRSTIELIYSTHSNGLAAEVTYDGPRKWVVSKYVVEIAESLAREAEREARSKQAVAAAALPAGTGSADYSAKLASISWVTKLIMKSVLIKNEVRVLGKGKLHSYIEELLSSGENIFRKYPAIYISGDGDDARFRMLFVGGELRGIYAVVGDKEFFGDDKPLNDVKGLVKLRVYGVLRLPD